MLTPTTLLALSIIAFLMFSAGLTLGWFFKQEQTEETRGKLKTMIAVIVTAVWMGSTIADILLTGYAVSPLIHALMGAIVGYFFTDDGIQFNIGRE